MEYTEKLAESLEAALEDSVLCERIAEAKEADEVRALLGEAGVQIDADIARGVTDKLAPLHEGGLASEDLDFIRSGLKPLIAEGAAGAAIGAYVAILCMVKYRRCLF